MDAVVTAVIAGLSALGVLTTRLNNRITELDSRIDAIDVKIAEKYVSKESLNDVIDRMESHMIRIENKLDKIIFK
tara:strand:+ start:120 stop:344 length:225 start_codon:yes stop_codon:yes gene_type:complete